MTCRLGRLTEERGQFDLRTSQVTIRDIAREAGVSVATVSRHLNGTARLRPETRARVQAVIDKYDYTPNEVARSLFRRSSGVIGLIMPEIDGFYFASLAQSVERAARRHGYEIFLCNTLDDIEREIAYIGRLRSRQIDGIILAGGATNRSSLDEALLEQLRLAVEGLPTVVINGIELGADSVNVNSIDDDVTVCVVDHLIRSGRRRIALLGGLRGITSFEDRVVAYRSALARHGLAVEEQYVVPLGFTIAQGRAAGEQLLACRPRPEAILAVNDTAAAGALQALVSHGIDVPRQMPVIGYDNSVIAASVLPRLSTFMHPYDEIAWQAVQSLAALMAGEATDACYRFAMTFIERESCQLGLTEAELDRYSFRIRIA